MYISRRVVAVAHGGAGCVGVGPPLARGRGVPVREPQTLRFSATALGMGDEAFATAPPLKGARKKAFALSQCRFCSYTSDRADNVRRHENARHFGRLFCSFSCSPEVLGGVVFLLPRSLCGVSERCHPARRTCRQGSLVERVVVFTR